MRGAWLRAEGTSPRAWHPSVVDWWSAQRQDPCHVTWGLPNGAASKQAEPKIARCRARVAQDNKVTGTSRGNGATAVAAARQRQRQRQRRRKKKKTFVGVEILLPYKLVGVTP